jgi:hypothetical protein
MHAYTVSLEAKLKEPFSTSCSTCEMHAVKVLGNSEKPVTLGTLGLTKFSKHVFQEARFLEAWNL